MTKHTSYYELLGVSSTATGAEIRKAYRVKALQSHPDRNNNTPDATAAFQHLKAVYEILSDPDRREEYDTCGPSPNLHSDDPAFDPEAVAAFFRTKKVSDEDIVAYQRVYREGDDEREDLDDFFKRMRGRVRRVVDYIPYSEDLDLVRFVRYWDEQIEKGNLDTSDEWVKDRKILLRRGKDKEREMKANEEEKPAKKKRKAAQLDDGMPSLAAMIRKRQQRDSEEFEKWCADVENREDGTQKNSSKRAKKASKPKAVKSSRQSAKRKSTT